MLRTLGAYVARQPLLAKPDALAFLIVAVVLVLKLVSVTLYVPASRSLFDLGFSFDPYVKALVEGKGFVGCEDFGCHRSSRMPAVPYFLAFMAQFTQSYKVVAYIKVLLLSGMSFFAIRAFARAFRPSTPVAVGLAALITLVLMFSPSMTKHMGALHYEEGYLIEIVAATTLLTLALLVRGPAGFSLPVAIGAVLLAALGYLIKSSQVLVLVTVSVIAISLALMAARRGAALLLLALAVAAPAGWLTHNYTTAKRITVMSSYDGENMFRGWNANTLKLYPQCGLDVLFTDLNRCQGKVLDLPHEISRGGFKDEWSWNDAYKARALDWIKANPGEALKTFAVKFVTVTAWPRLVPHVLEDDTTRQERYRGTAEELLAGAWIVVGRLIEFFGLGLALVMIAKGDGRARAIGAASLMMCACYAAPYILGFGVERHFSILILMSSLCTIVLASEWQRLKALPRG
ncbi:MAG: hypothetical protein LCH39_02470 [Proteobacteria bacterium]|nr:hypothetical protein [Pseudomonadota bacterium]